MIPVVKIKIEKEDSYFMHPADDTHRMASINIKSEENLVEGNSQTPPSNNAQSPGKNDSEAQMQKSPVVKIESKTGEGKTRLYIGNLPRGLILEELKALSSDIVDVCLPENRVKGDRIFTGFAFLQFDSEIKAKENYLLLKEKQINGKKIRVEFAEKPRDKKCDVDVKPELDTKCNMNIKAIQDKKCNMDVKTGQDEKCSMNVKTFQDVQSNMNVKTQQDEKCNMNVKACQDNKFNMNVKTGQDGKCIVNVKTGQDEKYSVNVKTFQGVQSNMNVKTQQDEKCNMNVKSGQGNKFNMNVNTGQDGKCIMNVKTSQDWKCIMDVKSGQDEKYHMNVRTFQGIKSNMNVKTERDEECNMNIKTGQNRKGVINVKTGQDNKCNMNMMKVQSKKCNIDVKTVQDGKCMMNVKVDQDKKFNTNMEIEQNEKCNMNVKTDQTDKWNMKKLIVRGLDNNVTINDVAQFFPRAVDLKLSTGHALKNAFVEYNSIQDAARDLEFARSAKINDKPITVTYLSIGEKSNMNVKTDQEDRWNMKKLIVRGLDYNVTIDEIAQFFPRAIDVDLYTGFTFKTAFVEYDNIEDAARDLDSARSAEINGKPLPVTYLSFRRKRKRFSNNGGPEKRARFNHESKDG